MLTMSFVRTENIGMEVQEPDKQSPDAIGWFDLKHIAEQSFEMDFAHIDVESIEASDIVVIEIFGSNFDGAIETVASVREISDSVILLIRVEGEAEVVLAGFKNLSLLNDLCRDYNARFICCDKRLLSLYPEGMNCLFLPAVSGFTIKRAKKLLDEFRNLTRPFILSCYGPSTGGSGRNTYVAAKLTVALAQEFKQRVPLAIINLGEEVSYVQKLGFVSLVTLPGQGTPNFLNVVRQSAIAINLDTSPHTQGRMAIDAAIAQTPYIHTGWQAGGHFLWPDLTLKSLDYDEALRLASEVLQNGAGESIEKAYELVDDYDISNFEKTLTELL